MHRIPILSAALALALPAAASAAPLPSTTYGGGSLPSSYRTGVDSASMAVSVAPDGQSMRVVANAVLDCGKHRRALQELVADGRLGADGRLTFDAPTHRYVYNIAGSRPRGTATVDLGFERGVASGTLRVVTTRAGRPCERTLRVQLRAAPPDTSPLGTPVAGAAYFGTGSVAYHRVAVPVELRVGSGGKRVAVTVVGAPLRCDGPDVNPYTDYLANYSPPMKIRSGGRFRSRERFSTRFKGGGVDRTKFRLSGRFTAQGARGSYSATMVARTPGQKPTRCKTGTVRWAAVR
ncbi:MAG TPA: hypothetical protein VF533_06840 [Solirubrobacteraceae bacterium]|jgi:hypothetical protein